MTDHKRLPFNQLLITRPASQANKLMTALSTALEPSQSPITPNQKIQLRHLPLLSIQGIDFELANISELAASGLNQDQHQFDGIIFISRHAASYFYAKQNNNISPITANQLYAVGDSSAAEVERLAEQPVLFPQQMNSEGLLGLPELQQIKQQNWLIVKGKGGRSLLKESLQQRGAIVFELDVYQRKLPSLTIQQAIIKQHNAQTVWLITSLEAMLNLCHILDLASQPHHQTKVIISSQRLAVEAKQKGFTIIAQSIGASTKQLVECIKNLDQRPVSTQVNLLQE